MNQQTSLEISKQPVKNWNLIYIGFAIFFSLAISSLLLYSLILKNQSAEISEVAQDYSISISPEPENPVISEPIGYYAQEVGDMYEIELFRGFKTLIPHGHIAVTVGQETIYIVESSYYGDELISDFTREGDIFHIQDIIDASAIKSKIVFANFEGLNLDLSDSQSVNFTLRSKVLSYVLNQCADPTELYTQESTSGFINYMQLESVNDNCFETTCDGGNNCQSYSRTDRLIAATLPGSDFSLNMIVFISASQDGTSPIDGFEISILKDMANHLQQVRYDIDRDA